MRIEDTDRERSTHAAVDAILDGLKWLGLDWDGEAISQFQRAERHREVAEQLLASGGAYRCYASVGELEQMREKARLEGKPMRYDGRWRDRDPAEAPPGVKPVIRLRASQEGETVIDDKVQGKVVFANKDLDDLVLLRSDGNPTYMLAVVVDDHDMGVTHIIRGDDHLTNAARQTQIYQALGWGVPDHGAYPAHSWAGRREALQAARRARRRRLPRLGLSAGRPAQLSGAARVEPGRQGVLQHRRADRRVRPIGAIGRSPSRFDFAKLENVNGHYMRAASDDALFAALMDALPYLPGGPEVAAKLDEHKSAQLRAAIPGLKERAKTLVELLDGAGFLFATRPLKMDAKAEEILARAGRLHLKNLLPRLTAPHRVDGGKRGGCRPRLRRRGRRKTRNRRSAVARGPDRPLDLARHLRRARGARARGEPRADRGSG